MSTPGFLEIQLDPLVSPGTKGGLGYTTIVVGNPSRIETRLPQQSRGYWKLELEFEKTKVNMNKIRSVYAAVQGKLFGWRFRNYREYYTNTDGGASGVIAAEPVTGYSSGTTMQLTHTRTLTDAAGTVQSETVLIRKPDLNSAGATIGSGTTLFNLYRDNNGVTPWASSGNWSLDVTTGIITFNSSQTGHYFWWMGYWDMPARFDTDDEDSEWADFDQFKWSEIKIMEIQV